MEGHNFSEEELMFPHHCDCEYKGFHRSGFYGILAHVENGEVTSNVERCDTCGRYETDRKANNALKIFLKRLKDGDLKDGWWEQAMIMKHTEKAIAWKLINGEWFKKAPQYINHPVLRYFAKAVLEDAVCHSIR